MWSKYVIVANLDEALNFLEAEGGKARVIAGGTDLMLEIERGQRKGIDTLVDISRVPGLREICLDEDGIIHIGGLVTHNDCAASKLIQEAAWPLAQACWQVGSPQIRNRGTIAGNLVTASPANDSITPLMALGAAVTLTSRRGERVIPLKQFYTGVRKSVIEPDEIVREIVFKKLHPGDRAVFLKQALRKAQAISVTNIALVWRMSGKTIVNAWAALGSVAPTIIRCEEAEQAMEGADSETLDLNKMAEMISAAAAPIGDIRGSAEYRRYSTKVFARKALGMLRGEVPTPAMPIEPVTLMSCYDATPLTRAVIFERSAPQPIRLTVNEEERVFEHGHQKSLLHLLRDEGGLTGSKEGCGEGECGACTMIVNGAAVMACLIPAVSLHGGDVRTIEGVRSTEGRLHPVQKAFIEEGAVQCGYCTPGFVMSAVKLLEEKPAPTRGEITQAVTGNLCRCTGYYKIVSAIEKAAQEKANG